MSKNLSVQQRKVIRDEEMKAQALKGLQYLLKKSMKISHYCKDKVEKFERNGNSISGNMNEAFEKTFAGHNILREKNQVESPRSDLAASVTKDSKSVLHKLKYFEGGVLKPYQEEGLIWLMILFENGINGILADEMGLGKTIQVIALICHLYEMNVDGPFLVIAPLSTIPNWQSEFKRFAPKIPIVVLPGTREARENAKIDILKGNYKIKNQRVKPVIITSYQIPLMEPQFLKRFKYQYIIVDEGHRLKNHESRLSKELSLLKCANKLLLTGTPLQNNMNELWALLNFLLPHIFVNIDIFSYLLQLEEIENNQIGEESTGVISTIHKILAPFMLRRLKCDVLLNLVPKKEMQVYCPMTKLQKELYSYVIERNITKLLGKEEESDDEDEIRPPKKRKSTRIVYYKELEEYDLEEMKEVQIQNFKAKEEKIIGKKLEDHAIQFMIRLTMQNPHMMFKKIVNHPYLVHFPLNPLSVKKELLIDEKLVQESGKMLVLDAMLAKLKEGGHKVLLFCTLVMMLDLIEDFILMRGYDYCRLDGNHGLESRTHNIKRFNEDPNAFLFLISTRAGGLGLNLTSADTVILYDRDWNPQVDIQAQDRCHRIGQTRPVMVYTLVTKNTIDEQIIQRGTMKRRLEKVVIKDGLFKSIKDNETYEKGMDFEELKRLLESDDCTNKIHSNGYVFTDKELNDILDRTDLYNEMEDRRIQNCTL